MTPNRVQTVRHVTGYILAIGFSDASVFEINLEPMLLGRNDSLHAPLLDIESFKNARANGLTIEWSTGLDVCPDELRRWCEAGKVIQEPFDAVLVSEH